MPASNALNSPFLHQPFDGFGMVNGIGAAGGVGVSSVIWYAKGIVDCSGKILRFLWIMSGVAANFVRGANDVATLHSATGTEDGLYCAPMVAPGKFGAGEGGNLWCAAKFTRHHDECFVELVA